MIVTLLRAAPGFLSIFAGALWQAESPVSGGSTAVRPQAAPESATVSLTKRDPVELARFLEEALAEPRSTAPPEGRKGGTSRTSFSAAAHPEGRAVTVVGSPDQVSFARSFLRACEQAGEEAPLLKRFPLRLSSGTAVAKGLTDLFGMPPAPPPGGGAQGDARILLWADQERRAVVVAMPPAWKDLVPPMVAELDRTLREDLKTRQYRLRYADPTEVARNMRALFEISPEEAALSRDEARHGPFEVRVPARASAIEVRATEADLAIVAALVESLDIPAVPTPTVAKPRSTKPGSGSSQGRPRPHRC